MPLRFLFFPFLCLPIMLFTYFHHHRSQTRLLKYVLLLIPPLKAFISILYNLHYWLAAKKKCETKKTKHNLRSTTTATVFLLSPNLLLSEQALNSSPHATPFMSIYPLSIISRITPWCQSLINQTIRATTRFYLLRILLLLSRLSFQITVQLNGKCSGNVRYPLSFLYLCVLLAQLSPFPSFLPPLWFSIHWIRFFSP